jgi:hypothetical protein
MTMRRKHILLQLAVVAASLTLGTASFHASSHQAQTGAQPPPTRPGPPAPATQGQQGPARDRQITVGTGTISGTVVVEGVGTPARRARVNLSGAELRPARSTTTDDKGFFTFTSLPAGRFTLNVSKPGYVGIAYGAKKPGRPGTPIQLADGQKIDRANVSLPKGAVVTGIVVDEYGEPSPRTQVRVMRFVTRTGERTLEVSDQGTTDDRGVYRVWGLQPGEYLVSAVPRNANLGEAAQIAAATIEALLQQVQAERGRGAGPGARGGMGNDSFPMLNGPGGGRGGGRGQQFMDEAARLQQAANQNQPQDPVAYAPVYYPGTTTSTAATPLTLGVGEERSGVDFQLQLVETAKVTGTITSPDGVLPQNTQVSLIPQTGGPTIPGMNSNSSRANNGTFSFDNVTPGQYTVMARAMIRPSTPAAQSDQAVALGRGGRGGGQGGQAGRGGPTQILWAAADIAVAGQNVSDITLVLHAGMTIGGRVAFEGTSLAPPVDLTRVRISLSSRGQQNEMGNVPPAQVDASGNFKIIGVAPGRYSISANVPPAAQTGAAAGGGRGGGGRGGGAGQAGPTGSWTLKSALVNGRDALDFPFDLRPNQEIGGALLTFGDQTQEVSGTLQDPTGRPMPDLTIIVFASDKQFWTPLSRRIASARPDTAGKFTVRGLPPGQYLVTAVTEVEPGEWFDPAFLQQLIGGSVTFQLAPGEKRTQDLRVAGGS